jgi:hypothetical protein
MSIEAWILICGACTLLGFLLGYTMGWFSFAPSYEMARKPKAAVTQRLVKTKKGWKAVKALPPNPSGETAVQKPKRNDGPHRGRTKLEDSHR